MTTSTPKKKKSSSKKSAAWNALKDEQHKLRRDLILKAASECLNERGYEGTTLARIADQLEMTNGALYYYFSGKMELAFECLMSAHANTLAQLEQAKDVGQNGLDMVEMFVVSVLKANLENRPWNRIGPAYFLNPEYARREQKAAKDNVTALSEIIEIGVNDQTIRRCDPGLTALLILGSLNLVVSNPMTAITMADEELIEVAKKFVSQSVTAGPRAS